MSRLKVYTYRNSSDTFLPADVIAALDEHSHIRQGRLFIWATSAAAAAERLTILNLRHCTARALRLAGGSTVDGLTAGHDWPDGTVLAMRLAGRSPVIEITDPSTEDVLALSRRAVRLVGRYTYDGHFFPSPELESEVTDANWEHATWRPMNEAPTDGTVIMARWDDAGMLDEPERIRWSYQGWYLMDADEPLDDDTADVGFSGWRELRDDELSELTEGQRGHRDEN
jgi:hypothetical protein